MAPPSSTWLLRPQIWKFNFSFFPPHFSSRPLLIPKSIQNAAHHQHCCSPAPSKLLAGLPASKCSSHPHASQQGRDLSAVLSDITSFPMKPSNVSWEQNANASPLPEDPASSGPHFCLPAHPAHYLHPGTLTIFLFLKVSSPLFVRASVVSFPPAWSTSTDHGGTGSF